jgi:hypothetical protein
MNAILMRMTLTPCLLAGIVMLLIAFSIRLLLARREAVAGRPAIAAPLPAPMCASCAT